MTYDAFVFDSYGYRDETGELSLRYRLEGGPAFEEKIVFPPATKPITQNELDALEACFRLIFLLSGVSYYKAWVPEKLVCRAFALDEATADFAEKVYRNGLGEFAWCNNIDLSGRVKFETEETVAWKPVALDLPPRALVPVGGGKDSIVTLECLKRAGANPTLFAAGTASGLAAPIKATIKASGLPYIQVQRILAANLAGENAKGALNGHVPITAILSAIAAACAVLHGFNAIVMSNEHSASEPNIRLVDREVNHQYSKSLAFEQDFAAFVHEHITPSLAYFSFLRPLTEAAIVRRFAKLEHYHGVFRSCNTAFRLDETKRGKTWCGDCPKCRFTFLALAPFVDKAALIAIFGKNLLAETAQKEGFAELSGLGAHKPFECVGEVEESALLIQKLARLPAWKDEAVIAELGGRFPAAKDFDKRFDALFAMRDNHLVPPRYLEMLSACA